MNFSNPFINPDLLWALVRSKEYNGPLAPVVFLGVDPFEPKMLFDLAEPLGVSVWNPHDGCSADGYALIQWTFFREIEPTLIVCGRDSFPEATVSTLLEPKRQADTPPAETKLAKEFWLYAKESAHGLEFTRSRNQEFSFVSQEMFVCHLLSDVPLHDLTESDDAWARHIADHPSLKKVQDLMQTEQAGFRWPTTHAPAASEPIVDGRWPEKGMLQFLGYRVGRSGDLPGVRREVLRRVFLAEKLPKVHSVEYVSEWGAANSANRLQKLAESIAAFCRNAKRRSGADMNEAVQNWQSDLGWLKKNLLRRAVRRIVRMAKNKPVRLS